MPHRNILFAVCLATLMGSAPAAPVPPSCGMAGAFNQPDDGGATTTAVWAQPDNAALLFGDSLHVNTDGTKRSYKVSDFWGEKDALNNLCNAMSDACVGLSSTQKRARRILTQQARAAGWPTAQLAATQLSSAILPFARTAGGRRIPCPEVDGFLVSATALFDPAVTNQCDLRRYVDALATNALVIPPTPGFVSRGAAVGDLAVAMRPDGTTYFAVVGDTGPRKQLGEASIALAGAILEKVNPPVNYNEVRGRGEFAGKGWDVPKAFVLIFPKTRNAAAPMITMAQINAAAAPAFARWGGIERLKACAAAYRRN